MKIKTLATALVLMAIFTSCKNDNESQVEQTPPPKEVADITPAEVVTTLNLWLNLWETYDLNLLDDIFLESETLTYYSSEKIGLIKGFKQLYPHHTGFGFLEGGNQPKTTHWLEEIETRIYGNTAMVAAVWYNTDYGAAKETAQNGPVTFVLVRNDRGEVKIAHSHFANYK